MKKISGTLLLFLSVMFFSCDNSDKNDTCGDNFIDVGEECDGYDLGGNYCQALGFYGGALECNDVCRLNKNDCMGYGFCGDGVIQPYNESCDGDNLSGSSCSSLGYESGDLSCTDSCRFNISNCEGAGSCGNGIADFPEQCDATDLNGATCLNVNMGFVGGTLKCGSDCRFDFSSCYKTVTCGNGIIEGDEDCDSGNLNNADCESLGFSGGRLFCKNDCSFDTSSCEGEGFICGNGVKEGNEECDSTDFGDQDCTDFGFETGDLKCESNCKISVENCMNNPEECGNGVVEGNEECDATDFNNQDCSDFFDGVYAGSFLSCNENCKFDFSDCMYCGNGIIEGDEECDSSELGNVTCEDYGFANGVISCTDGCYLDLSGCSGVIYTYLSSGAYHNCGIFSPTEIKCWGDNGQGQLGTGDTSFSSSATPLLNVLNTSSFSFDNISSGLRHSCVLTDTDEVFCWGHNIFGQLGDGSYVNSATPLPVLDTFGLNFTEISCAGNSSYALTASGEIKSWGSNYKGQLGNGTTEDSTVLSTVINLTGTTYSYLSAGNSYACGIDNTGTAWCWGENNGRLGDGSGTDSATPVQVDMPQGITFSVISAGLYHTCALDASGNAWCWGFNSNGQLGDGSNSNANSPIAVFMPESVYFTRIKVGAYHTCALDSEGKIWCWGSNTDGQLGDGKVVNNSALPQAVNDVGVSFVDFDSGYYHICATDENNEIWCWGQNYSYQLGIEGSSFVPTKIINP